MLKIPLTQDELQCNYCGFVWEPTSELEETRCPSCRRNPDRDYGKAAPMGDVPIARIKAEEARLKAAAQPVKKVKI